MLTPRVNCTNAYGRAPKRSTTPAAATIDARKLELQRLFSEVAWLRNNPHLQALLPGDMAAIEAKIATATRAKAEAKKAFAGAPVPAARESQSVPLPCGMFRRHVFARRSV